MCDFKNQKLVSKKKKKNKVTPSFRNCAPRQKNRPMNNAITSSSNNVENGERATPPEIIQQANTIATNAIPTASAKKYAEHYDIFQNYLKNHGGIRPATETTVIGFYGWLCEPIDTEEGGKRERYAVSSRSAIISALKTMLFAKEFDKSLPCWATVNNLISDAMKKHEPKQAEVIEEIDLLRYFQETPNKDKDLVRKTAVSLAIACGARITSIYKLQDADVVRRSDGGYSINLMHVKQVEAVLDKSKELSPNGADKSPYHPSQYIDLYRTLRADLEKKVSETPDAFFLQVRDGKMVNMRVGQRNLADFYKEIATYLGLANPERYTSHGIKRFAATNAIDKGAPLMAVQQLLGHKNPQTVQRYYASSVTSKRNASDYAAGSRSAASAARRRRPQRFRRQARSLRRQRHRRRKISKHSMARLVVLHSSAASRSTAQQSSTL